MRFQQLSIIQEARRLDGAFSLLRLTDVDEYGCFLFRCEGEIPLHRHLDHDELFWPLDRAITLRDPAGGRTVEAGELVRVPRGWRHGTAASEAAHVMLFSRAERSLTMNGHLADDVPQPPEWARPTAQVGQAADNEPLPLIGCDQLRFFVERVTGTGESRRAEGDTLLVPLQGALGLRCGGIVTVLAEGELARVPAGSGWHLFGEATLIWTTARRSQPTEEQHGAGRG